MVTNRTRNIEQIVINDITSNTGKRIIGFITYYENCHFTHSCAMFDNSCLTFHAVNGDMKNVRIDSRIEALDIYHNQYGISLSEAHNCFFITSWLKGIYCCNLDTGKILWNYRLKHAQSIITYDDYLVCDFQEIGLRKISYDGVEIAKYPITTYQTFLRLDEAYVFCGPNRRMYNIIDTRSMNNLVKIRESKLSPCRESLIILGIEGTYKDFTINGFEDEQPFKRRIRL